MKIVEYDGADPLGVLHLNLMSLRFALTPERVALIRQLDPRPFPFFALYAIADGIVGELKDGFQCRPGRAWMAMTWSKYTRR